MTERKVKHSLTLKQNVVLLFEDGLTATQVAKIINKRFRSETLGNLSRCAALGIKWREGKCEKNKDEVSRNRLITALRG